ncbi:MAG: carboxypeptidase regulatory-like domain-containing protein [Candidatus Acidiferrales bacterium]
MTAMTKTTGYLFFFLLSMPLAGSLWGQTTGSFSGTVTDPAGAGVPDAKVTVKSSQIDLSRTTNSNAQGEYLVPLLPPGTYDFDVSAKGFQTYVRTNVILNVNQSERVDIQLVVGKIEQKVIVSGTETEVDTSTPTLSQVIDTREVNNLPLNGRNFLQLTVLVPGSVPGIQMTQNFTPTTAGTNSLNLPQVNGLRNQSNNVLLDGTDDNEIFLGEAAAVPSPDAIREFSIQTNLYGAEFGRGAGSIVNIVTKSGSNSFHGSLYEYLRNDVLDARNFFALEKPPLKRNQFGGALGGPIIRQHTYFFVNYEGTRLRQGVTDTATVPSLLEKQGDFSQDSVKPIDPATGLPFPQNKIPSTSWDPVANNLLQFYPDPNVGTNLFTSSPVSPTNEDNFLVRIDQNLGSKDTLFGTYYYQDGNAVNPFATAFLGPINVPEFPVKDAWKFQHLVLSETHVFSSRAVNEFRFGFNRNALIGLSAAIPRNATDFGFTFPSTVPINLPQWAVSGFTVNGYTDMGPGDNATNTFQWNDTFSLVKGRHNLKFGIDIRRYQLNANIASAFNGAYNFTGAVTGNSFADFLLGQPLFFLQGGGNPVMYLRASSFNFFAEDGISVSRKLKVTLGLRYELPTWPYELNNKISAFRPGEQSIINPDAPVGLVYPGDPGVPRSTVNNPRRDFAPRIGIAWDPTGSGKTSIRAGYGIFYDSIPWHDFNQLQIAPPFSFFPFVSLPGEMADPYHGAGPFLPGLTSVPFSDIPFPIQYNVLAQNLKTPYAQQYNLTVQHEFWAGWLAQVGYVGTIGTHLPNTLDLNQAVFVPGQSTPDNIEGRRPFGPNFSSILAQSTAWTSNYNSLQASVQKKMSRGLTLLAAYTWSHAIDTLSTPQAFRNAVGQQNGAMNNYDLSLDRGNAAFDATQRFVVSYLYEFPEFQADNKFVQKVMNGWGVNGIVAFQSGTPFTILDPTDSACTGNTNGRADLVGDPHLSNRSISEYFNTGAFAPVGLCAGYGNSGRNMLRGPGANNWDFAIVKNTRFGESKNVQFRSEFFNLWNHPGFENPVSDITSPNFGQILQTRPNNERQIQMVLRFEF